jgi:hypothetical protein
MSGSAALTLTATSSRDPRTRTALRTRGPGLSRGLLFSLITGVAQAGGRAKVPSGTASAYPVASTLPKLPAL